mgnify:CR=1 FL=1
MLTSLHCNGPSRHRCSHLLLSSPSHNDNNSSYENNKPNDGHWQADDQAKIETAAAVVVVVVKGISTVA